MPEAVKQKAMRGIKTPLKSSRLLQILWKQGKKNLHSRRILKL